MKPFKCFLVDLVFLVSQTCFYSLLIFRAYSLQANIKPVHCKSVLRFSSPAFTENPRSKAVSPATPAQKKYGHQVPPAGHSAIQVTPDAEAFRCVEMKTKEEEQNVAVTPESITPSSMELDTTFSLEGEEEEEEEDCQSSTASSSLPSPEIFRKESYGVCLCVCMLILYILSNKKLFHSIF